jgi:zinc D-Ala-D-Ala carboxypeptidase
MNLSEHFTLAELTRTDHRKFDNTPTADAFTNLSRLALLLEQVKVAVGGKPVMINSGYRSPQVNAAVGSKPTSQHCSGCAADLRVPGMTTNEIILAILDADLLFDQVIREFDSWVHISVANSTATIPRRQALVIDKAGTRLYAR